MPNPEAVLTDFQRFCERGLEAIAAKKGWSVTERRIEIFPRASGSENVLSMHIGTLEFWIDPQQVAIGGASSVGAAVDERYERVDYDTPEELVQRVERQAEHLLGGGTTQLKHWG